MVEVSLSRALRHVLRKHHLADGAKGDDVSSIARDLCGLHATDPVTPYLSLFARMHHFQREDLDVALFVKKLVGRVRCWRKTIHILPPEMMPWAFVATQPYVSSSSKKYLEYRGVSLEQYATLSREILAILETQELPVAAIKKKMGGSANFSAVVNLMCDQFLLIRAKPRSGWRSNQHTYAPFSHYFPQVSVAEVQPEHTRCHLFRAYLATYGPASEVDMAWWSGLAKKEVRLALERLADEWETVTLSPLPGEYYILRDHLARLNALKPNSTPQVTLLPLLDPYMMGYKDRVRYLDPDRNQFVFDKGGNAVATVLIDGRVIGVWDASGSPPRLVKVYLWDDVGTGLLKIITTRTKEIAAFLGGTDVQVKYCESMVPLTQRTAGGFMTPLKDS